MSEDNKEFSQEDMDFYKTLIFEGLINTPEKSEFIRGCFQVIEQQFCTDTIEAIKQYIDKVVISEKLRNGEKAIIMYYLNIFSNAAFNGLHDDVRNYMEIKELEDEIPDEYDA